MIREGDESGVSGIGKVAEGVIFEGGFTVIRWCTEHGPNSFVFFQSFADFSVIHCYSHPTNRTLLKFDDGEEIRAWKDDQDGPEDGELI